MSVAREPLQTLEPLIDAVTEGIEGAGWILSGLQKTTSHEYAGRWSGESSRSAYLFFHEDSLPDGVSVDVLLDETSRGIQGNLALVVEGPELVSLGDARAALAAAAAAADERLPRGYRTPIALRLRLADSGSAVESATVELRVKVRNSGCRHSLRAWCSGRAGGGVGAGLRAAARAPGTPSVHGSRLSARRGATGVPLPSSAPAAQQSEPIQRDHDGASLVTDHTGGESDSP